MFVILLLGGYIPLLGQYQIGLIPRSSPDKGVYHKIGFTEIDIRYGSPSVKGRTIWGDVEPYDKVWRAGANNATTISFSTDVIIEGKPLAKGTYAFFLIPRKDLPWIAIFSNNSKQWGAFGYEENEDALRVEVAPKQYSPFQEELTYQIQQHHYHAGAISLLWEAVQITLTVETDYVKQFISAVETRAQEADSSIQSVVYLQGAEHLLNIQDSLDLALNWIQQSESLLHAAPSWDKRYYPKDYVAGHMLWIKAQLLAEKKYYSEALVLARQLSETLFYQKEKEDEAMDEKVSNWEVQEKVEAHLSALQVRDTLISRGSYFLNFTVVPGEGTPILFESGAGNDGTVWRPIISAIHEATKAPIILYDRAGFGKSTLDSSQDNCAQHGILQGLTDLEYGLKALGYEGDIHLVAHSYGGYFAYLYANRHPQRVKSIVAIDIVHKYHTEGWADRILQEMESDLAKWKVEEQGLYCLMETLPEAANIIKDLSIPAHIPVMDVIPEPEEKLDEGGIRWQKIHQDFVASHPLANRKVIKDAGHYVWEDKPQEVISIITDYYDRFDR